MCLGLGQEGGGSVGPVRRSQNGDVISSETREKREGEDGDARE